MGSKKKAGKRRGRPEGWREGKKERKRYVHIDYWLCSWLIRSWIGSFPVDKKKEKKPCPCAFYFLFLNYNCDSSQKKNTNQGPFIILGSQICPVFVECFIITLLKKKNQMLSIVTPQSDAKTRSAALVRFHGLALLLAVSTLHSASPCQTESLQNYNQFQRMISWFHSRRRGRDVPYIDIVLRWGYEEQLVYCHLQMEQRSRQR